MIPLDKGSNDFLVKLNGAREAYGFMSQSFETCSKYQVVMLYTLCEDSPGQMYIAGDFLGVAPT